MMLPVSELHDFPGHPFQVRDDEEMGKLAESITQHGVLMPGLVRPRAAGGYEIVAGHRRKFKRESGKCPLLSGTWMMIPPLF